MPALTPFTSILARRSRSADAVDFDIPGDWQQGRTAFGGVVSAVAAQAMRDVAGADWPAEVSLRGLQSSFVAVVEPGPVQVRVEVLRQGRNVCQVLARLSQGPRLCSVLLGVYSADRPSTLQPCRLVRPPAAREAEELPPAAAMGLLPGFLQHIDLRWAEGPRPFSGTPGHQTSLHLRLRDESRGSIEPEVLTVLLADVSATPALGQLNEIAASSSVTWALELRPFSAAPGRTWWRADNESLVVDGGYVNHAARLWAPSGELAALGTQVVTVFA